MKPTLSFLSLCSFSCARITWPPFLLLCLLSCFLLQELCPGCVFRKETLLRVFLRLIVAGCLGLGLSFLSQKCSPITVNSGCLISSCQFLSWHFTTMYLYLCFCVRCVDSFTATALYQFSEGRGQIE